MYKHIYTRYLTPGEAIIHDRGPEFANNTAKKLYELHKTEVRIISTGRPQGNGQAEAVVKQLKHRMIVLMSENSNLFTR